MTDHPGLEGEAGLLLDVAMSDIKTPGTLRLDIDQPISCFVPGRGMYVGTLGWAIAPDYMAERANAKTSTKV